MSENQTTHDDESTENSPTVTLLNATPNPEETICRAARNDYSAEGVGGRSFKDVMATVDGDTIEEKKETLIHHLLSHSHFGPLEHCTATFSIEGISRACMAQLTRHRHATFDITSQRYVKFDEMDAGEAVVQIPELSDPGTPGRNASFSDEYALATDDLILEERQRVYQDAVEHAFESYRELLDQGVAPEHARMVLPIGACVNVVMSVNLRMLLHIADLRAAGDAQGEIRHMTEQLLDTATEWSPIVMNYYRGEMQGRKNRIAP